jgi:hypothetical protein
MFGVGGQRGRNGEVHGVIVSLYEIVEIALVAHAAPNDEDVPHAGLELDEIAPPVP